MPPHYLPFIYLVPRRINWRNLAAISEKQEDYSSRETIFAYDESECIQTNKVNTKFLHITCAVTIISGYLKKNVVVFRVCVAYIIYGDDEVNVTLGTSVNRWFVVLLY